MYIHMHVLASRQATYPVVMRHGRRSGGEASVMFDVSEEVAYGRHFNGIELVVFGQHRETTVHVCVCGSVKSIASPTLPSSD